jgi:UDP-N-acetylglucosamine pyrophosphorylase
MSRFQEQRMSGDWIRTHALENAAQKLERTLDDEGFKMTPKVEAKLEELVKENYDLNGENITREEILKLALENVCVNQGLMPEALQTAYLNLVIDAAAKNLTDEDDIRDTVSENIVKLDKAGIHLQFDDLYQMIKEKFDAFNYHHNASGIANAA